MATPVMATGPRKNGMATAGMICGIVGILLCWFPFVGLIAGLLGIIFGAIGMSRAGRLYGAGRGAAITGLVCGILSFLLLPIMAAIAIPAFLEYMNKSKASQSTLSLRRLETRIKTYHIEHAELPPSAQEMPGPAGTACSQRDRKFPPRPISDWHADEGWRALDFMIDEPTPWSFKWTRTSDKAGTLETSADLDCDNVISTTSWKVEVLEGNVVVLRSPATGD
jgi:type II secretory pathway pseudopilin PulG